MANGKDNSVRNALLITSAVYFGILFILYSTFYYEISGFLYNTFDNRGHDFFRTYQYLIVFLFYVVLTALVYGFTALYREKRRRRTLIHTLTSQLDLVFRDDDTRLDLGDELSELSQRLNTAKLENINNRQAAQLAEQRKNDLVMYLAHDIRTPLTSVIGYLSLLDEAEDMPAGQRKKYLSITLDKAYRLENLINEFFDITRFNLQNIVLEKREINLGHMLSQMADEFYPILAPQNKTIRVETDGPLFIRGDADKLARVFNNVLKNAAAYSYADTEILLRAGREGGRARVDVVNRGATIPPERVDTIFEKFFRLDSARGTESGGAGLGLAIAREIVDAHNGEISVTSDSDVTTFHVLLPM